MIYFVGAGSGAPDLITLRGARLLDQADVVVYAGSLVNPALLERCPAGAKIYNSASMTLEEIIQALTAETGTIVRLHTGDPSLYGAIAEQMRLLDELGYAYEVVPGVSSFCAAAAALEVEYTLPGVSQSLIITRIEGRTPVPENEQLARLASHQTSMAIFLSTGHMARVQAELLSGGYPPDTPVAVVYKASWPEQEIFHCRLDGLAKLSQTSGLKNTALILVGRFLSRQGDRSLLYHPDFSTLFREAGQ